MINFNHKSLNVLLLAVITLAWLGGVHSLLSRNIDEANEITLRRKQLGYQKGVLLKEKEFTGRYEALKSEIGSGSGPDEKLSLFISRAEKWAAEENILLHDVRPLPASNKDGAAYVKLTLELEGEMNALGRFMHKMLSSREPVQIDRFNFYQKIKMRPQVNLDMEISLLLVE